MRAVQGAPGRRCAGRRRLSARACASAAADPQPAAPAPAAPPPPARQSPPAPAAAAPSPAPALSWTRLHKPVVPLSSSVSYTQFLRDVRSLAVKEVLLSHEGTFRALVVYTDGRVRYVQLPEDDPRVAGVLSTYGVTASLAPPEPRPPDSGRQAAIKDVATFWVPAACIGLVYAVVQRINVAKGDFEDREKLRKLSESEREQAKRAAAEEAEEDRLGRGPPGAGAAGGGEGMSAEDGAAFMRVDAKRIRARGPAAAAGDEAGAAPADEGGDGAAGAEAGAPGGGGGGGAPAPARRKPRNKSLTSNLKLRRDERIGFDDVAGIGDAKLELMEVVDFFLKPEKYKRSGSKVPKGVLLVGPPGTGKTLLARAVAGEAGVDFFSITASEFVEMFVGVGAARVRSLFEQARAAAPAIVFIDEIDAVGRKRGGGGSGNDERDATLNQLLSELDGFSPAAAGKQVVVLAATNRPDVLDAALVRPGRFDRRVHVPPPDAAGRADVLRVHCRGKPLGDDVDLGAVAADTQGFTGAALANLVNLAALAAARAGAPAVSAAHFEAALETATLGRPTAAAGASPGGGGGEGAGDAPPPAAAANLALRRAAAALALELLPTAGGAELVSVVAREQSPDGFVRPVPAPAAAGAAGVTAAALADVACAALWPRAAERRAAGGDPGAVTAGGEAAAALALARAACGDAVFLHGFAAAALGTARALAYPAAAGRGAGGAGGGGGGQGGGAGQGDYLGWDGGGGELTPPHVGDASYCAAAAEAQRLLQAADARAAALVDAHWPAVAAAAAALAARGTLTGAELRAAAGLPPRAAAAAAKAAAPA